MTVIAWDGKTLAADKRMGFGVEFATVTKIVRIRGCLVGWAGGSALGRAMVEWFRNGCNVDSYPAAQRASDTVGVLLVVQHGGLVQHYATEPYPCVIENEYYAVGSGSQFASAAMHLGLDARRAVEVACALDMNCGNGIDTLELP